MTLEEVSKSKKERGGDKMLSPSQKESLVREYLSEEFEVTFSKGILPLKTRRKHEFDLVAQTQDGRIVGEIKTDKHTDKGYLTTRFPRAMLACRYLELVDAKKKLMVFTDEQFYQRFEQDSEGLLMDNIEIMLVKLSKLRRKG